MYAKLLVLKSRFSDTDTGASMVEYALLVVLIAIIAFVAVQVAGQEVSAVFDDIAQELSTANS